MHHGIAERQLTPLGWVDFDSTKVMLYDPALPSGRILLGEHHSSVVDLILLEAAGSQPKVLALDCDGTLMLWNASEPRNGIVLGKHDAPIRGIKRLDLPGGESVIMVWN
jgi:hypothetical protein